MVTFCELPGDPCTRWQVVIGEDHLAGIELRQTELEEPNFYHELSWSPDGKYLADWNEASGLKIFSSNE